jgi:hypothetical protein
MMAQTWFRIKEEIIMNFKKIFFAIFLVLFISISGFSQTENNENFGSIGVTRSYNFFSASIWSIGCMAEFLGIRSGMSFGEATVTYEKENPYSSTNKLTEYWQRSLCMDLIIGYVFQKNIIDNLAVRLGGDVILSISPAYQDQHRTYGGSNLDVFNWIFTGVVGVKYFLNKKYFISFDVCPGYATLIAAIDKGAFVMPMRLGAGLNY